MIQQHLKKYNHSQLNTIIQELEIPDELRDSIASQSSDVGILNTLISQKHYSAAVKFLALGLPKREAVWWAYICVETVEKNKQDLQTQQALKATSEWVRQPSEENRQKVEPLAKALELYTPASWAAMAVFWSGENIAPPGRKPVKPAEFMSGHAVSNAIFLAAEESEATDDQLKTFLKQGLHICMGGNGRIQ